MIKRGTAEKRFRAVYQTHTTTICLPLVVTHRIQMTAFRLIFFIYVSKRVLTHLLLIVESGVAWFGFGIFHLKQDVREKSYMNSRQEK